MLNANLLPSKVALSLRGDAADPATIGDALQPTTMQRMRNTPA